MIDVVLGLQYGDEGKGKIVQYLLNTGKYKACARFQGAGNAGHTIYVNDTKIVLHQLPTSIVFPDIISIMGNGMVIDPKELVEEIENLRSLGFSITSKNLWISERAHIIFQYHKDVEKSLGTDVKIGTTKKGIGPAYSDKYARTGVTFGEFLTPSSTGRSVREMKKMFETGLVEEGFLQEDLYENTVRILLEFIRPNKSDIHNIIRKENTLAEGAQATFLDIDHGDYPFVTSSNTTIGGVLTGLGAHHGLIRDVYGVFKAYCSKVGTGAFNSELPNSQQELIREIGREYGATTGRPRRIGWTNLSDLNYACNLNGVNKLAITRLDTMEEISKKMEVSVISKYNKKIDFPKFSIDKFLRKIELDIKRPIDLISIGPNMNDVKKGSLLNKTIVNTIKLFN